MCPFTDEVNVLISVMCPFVLAVNELTEEVDAAIWSILTLCERFTFTILADVASKFVNLPSVLPV